MSDFLDKAGITKEQYAKWVDDFDLGVWVNTLNLTWTQGLSEEKLAEVKIIMRSSFIIGKSQGVRESEIKVERYRKSYNLEKSLFDKKLKTVSDELARYYKYHQDFWEKN